MKKFFTILLSTVMVMSLAACGSANETDKVAETEEVEVSAEVSENETEDVTETAEEASGEVTIKHELGELTVEVNPEKILVCDYGMIDLLDSVGIEAAGLPKGTLPSYLDKYASDDYANIGTLKEVDFELINEMAPDLIVISGRLSSSYEELNNIAPTLYVNSGSSDYLETLKANVDTFSTIFPAKADDLNSKYDEIALSVETLQVSAEESGLKALVLLCNDGSLSAYGPGSRYGVIHSDFGFAAADATIDSSTHGMEASFEYIAEVNPDVIFVIDRSAAIGTEGATGAETLLDNDIVNATVAAQNGKIVYLSSDVWYLATGGFTGTEQMIDEVSSGIE